MAQDFKRFEQGCLQLLRRRGTPTWNGPSTQMAGYISRPRSNALLAGALVAGSVAAAGATTSKVTAVRFWSRGDVTRVAVEVSSEFRYRSELSTVLDRAELIRSGNEFHGTDTLARLRSFVEKECLGRNLARLTLSARDADLLAATNPVMMTEADPDKVVRAGWVRFDFGIPEVAQVWCFADDATAFLRTKGGVTQRQLRGKRNARDLTFNGAALTLVGLLVQARWVSLFARVSALPDLEVAESVHDALEERIGSPLFLTLRTDAFFYQAAGPLWDVFSDPLPRGSATAYLERLHIECPPRNSGHRCEVRRSWLPKYLARP